MLVLAIIFILFISLSYWRKKHQEYVTLQYKYDVYRLRDRLRALAIEGKIDSNSWIFEYYDYSFSKAIGESYFITLFRVLVLYLRHENDEELIELRNKMTNELEANPQLKELQDDFSDATAKYAAKQHLISVSVILIVFSPLIGTSVIVSKAKKWLDGVIVFPETSGSNLYFNP